jgi:hypothetical protein
MFHIVFTTIFVIKCSLFHSVWSSYRSKEAELNCFFKVGQTDTGNYNMLHEAYSDDASSQTMTCIMVQTFKKMGKFQWMTMSDLANLIQNLNT